MIVVILLLIYWIFRQPNREKLRASQLDKARDQLQKIRAEAAELPSELAATRISLVIRRYLATAFDEPALFETNEEFCLRDTALEQLHPDCRQPITQHLTALSQLKYAPKTTPQSQDATTQLVDEAENILAEIELNVGTEKN